MTRHDPTSTPADGPTRAAALALGLTALALLGAATAAGAAQAQTQPDGPTVRVVGGTTTADGTTTVRVVLSSAPDGLAGYYLDLSVGTPEVARVESASYPERFGPTSAPAVGLDGATVTLEAADAEGAVEPGASNVTLATVGLAGVAPGETELVVEPRQFDADDGSAVRPAVRAGVVTVTGNGSDAGGTRTGAGADTAGDASGGAAVGSADPTSTTAPLSAGVVVVAVGLLAAVGLGRRSYP